MTKIVMATKAMHKLGDISRDEPDYAHIYDENETDYIGYWLTGLGFIDVTFPKDGCREMTSEEAKYLAEHEIVIN